MSDYEKHKSYITNEHRPNKARLQKQYIAIFVLIIFLFIASTIVLCMKANSLEERAEASKSIVGSSNADKPRVLSANKEPKQTEILTAASMRYIGDFKITAYCPCSECCGKWSKNRPKDKNGNEIVYTASGAIATPSITVAVDPDYIPYGTRLLIDGHEYVAQDTGAAVKGNVIDIYFNTHAEAEAWGCQYHSVYVIEEV